MSGLAYRLYHDAGLAILRCKLGLKLGLDHKWVNASYREQACMRCPDTFRRRPDMR